MQSPASDPRQSPGEQPGAEPSLDKLAKEAVTTVKDAESARDVADEVSRREADDRSWIAKWIIWVFAAVTGWELLDLAGEGWLTGKWAEAANLSIDLIKSCVFPVVTLVLGYYFGRSGKG